MGKEVIKFINAELLLCAACDQPIVYERESDNPFKFWENHKLTPAHITAMSKR